jgi:hypothetical protein
MQIPIIKYCRPLAQEEPGGIAPGWPQELLLALLRLGYHPYYPSMLARTALPDYSIGDKLCASLCQVPASEANSQKIPLVKKSTFSR